MIRCRFKWCNAFIKFLILLHNNERNIFHTDQHIFSFKNRVQYDNSGVSVRVHKGYGDAGSTRVSFSTWVSKCHGDMLKKICRKGVSHIIFVSPAGVKCHQRGDPGQVWNGWFIVCQSTYDLDWKQHHVKSPRSNDLLYKTIAHQDV